MVTLRNQKNNKEIRFFSLVYFQFYSTSSVGECCICALHLDVPLDILVISVEKRQFEVIY